MSRRTAVDSQTARHAQSDSSRSEPVPPVRTCVGCRQRESSSALVRIVAGVSDTGDLVAVVDHRRRLPGRGAWLHPRSDCLRQAERRRAVGRALRVAGPLDLSALTRELADDQREL